MPWTTQDVDKHRKGLTDAQKKRWVEVANSALESCKKKGGNDCDASAIRQANGVVANTEMGIYANPNADYEIQTKTIQGRQHLVVPVVMMVEGVHNGSFGPLLHLAEDLGRFPQSWNGIPVVVGHPQSEGQFISANSPDIAEQGVVGRVYNSYMDGTRLLAEAWLDEERLRDVSMEVVDHIQSGKPLEVSLGMFNEEEYTTGIYHNEQYSAIARNHRPDHLALLPSGTGACSWADGCGVRVNEEGVVVHGGPGSGNFGHAGIPGHLGGSADEGGSKSSERAVIKKLVALYKNGYTDEELSTVIDAHFEVRENGSTYFVNGGKVKNNILNDIVQLSNNMYDAHEMDTALDRLSKSYITKNEEGVVIQGGPGSGNFGHSGIPGHLGGSADEGMSEKERKEAEERRYGIGQPATVADLQLKKGSKVVAVGGIGRVSKGDMGVVTEIMNPGRFEMARIKWNTTNYGTVVLPLGDNGVSFVRKAGSNYSENNSGPRRTKFDNNSNFLNKEVETMANEGKPCCEDLVNELIANERTKFKSEDKEWLLTMKEDQLQKLIPEKEKVPAPVVQAAPQINAEQVKKWMKESMGKLDDYLELLPAEVVEQIKSGLRTNQERRAAMIQSILANTKVWAEDELKSKNTDDLVKTYQAVVKDVVDYSLNAGGGNPSVNEEMLLPAGVEETKSK